TRSQQKSLSATVLYWRRGRFHAFTRVVSIGCRYNVGQMQIPKPCQHVKLLNRNIAPSALEFQS
ncbi:MAG TPA: hypothetical protein VF089_15820, partial [Candidatus Binatia bacterium]